MSLPTRWVALETSGPEGSVAVAVEGNRTVSVGLDEPRRHAAMLMPALARALSAADLPRRAIEGVVIGAGPGSFTGLRVAAAAGKGLAHALAIPLWAVSSLDAAARGGPQSPEHDPLAVLFDARGRRLFVATYRGTEGGVARESAPRFTTLDELLQNRALKHHAMAGSGALRHAQELATAGRHVLPAPHGVPTAEALIDHVRATGAQPVPDPWGWEPDYLRATGAERLRSANAYPAVG